jgi:hypothetical protein
MSVHSFVVSQPEGLALKADPVREIDNIIIQNSSVVWIFCAKKVYSAFYAGIQRVSGGHLPIGRAYISLPSYRESLYIGHIFLEIDLITDEVPVRFTSWSA